MTNVMFGLMANHGFVFVYASFYCIHMQQQNNDTIKCFIYGKIWHAFMLSQPPLYSNWRLHAICKQWGLVCFCYSNECDKWKHRNKTLTCLRGKCSTGPLLGKWKNTQVPITWVNSHISSYPNEFLIFTSMWRVS